MTNDTTPSINKRSFSCPHCGAFSDQTWYTGHANGLGTKKIPSLGDTNVSSRMLNPGRHGIDAHTIINDMDIYSKNEIVLYEHAEKKCEFTAANLFLSKCFSCGKTATWIHDKLVYPPKKLGPLPNKDMPEDIREDFEEARGIIDLSPRSAAALLRLAIQKLCKHLGEPGKDINADIGSLVKKGLDPVIQQALDVVRVNGNAAVHPSEIDLKDDRSSVMHLLDIVNVIADQMISHPKKIKEMYASLPAGKIEGIIQRDKQ